MKNLLVQVAIMLHILILASCQKLSDENSHQDESNENIQSKSTTEEGPFDQLIGLPVNIYLAQPYGNGIYAGAWTNSGYETGDRVLVLKDNCSTVHDKFILNVNPTSRISPSYIPGYVLEMVGRLKTVPDKPVYWTSSSSYIWMRQKRSYTDEYPITFIKAEGTNDEYYIFPKRLWKRDLEFLYGRVIVCAKSGY